MSDRSAKLLLEVARAIEQDAERNSTVKMGCWHDLHISMSLLDEVRTWAEGYRLHIDQKCRAKREGKRRVPSAAKLLDDNIALRNALAEVVKQRDSLLTDGHIPEEVAEVGVFFKEVTISFKDTYEPKCYRDVDNIWVEGKFLCLSSTRHGVQWDIDKERVSLIDDGDTFYRLEDFVTAGEGRVK